MNAPLEVSAAAPSPGRFLASAVAMVAVAGIWLAGVEMLARTGVAFEILLVVLFPLATVWRFGIRYPDQRLVTLVVLESSFLVLCIVDQLALTSGWTHVQTVVRYGVLAFFLAQGGGFIRYQLSRGHHHGAAQMAVATSLLLLWWLDGGLGVLDAEGRYLVLGSETPWQVRLGYVVWLLNPLLVQSRLLPCMGQALVQGTSTGVALLSGSFFHVRILTACHAMVVDLLLGFARAETDHAIARALILPTAWRPALERVQRLVPPLTTGFLLLMSVLYAVSVLSG